MTDLQRGSIVTRGGDRGVVWTAWPDRLVLLPVADGPRTYASDVEITELADRVACLLTGPAVVQTGRPYSVTRDRQTPIGKLSEPCLARVALAHVAAQREVLLCEKWAAERRHRHAGFDERTALR